MTKTSDYFSNTEHAYEAHCRFRILKASDLRKDLNVLVASLVHKVGDAVFETVVTENVGSSAVVDAIFACGDITKDQIKEFFNAGEYVPSVKQVLAEAVYVLSLLSNNGYFKA